MKTNTGGPRNLQYIRPVKRPQILKLRITREHFRVTLSHFQFVFMANGVQKIKRGNNSHKTAITEI